MIPMPDELRSQQWFARTDEMGIRHRSVLGTLGFDMDRIAGRPVIGICNPRSELNNCELGFREISEAVRRGVTEAGGIALEFPTMALGADLLKPSDLLYRNLVAMDVEETIRGYPLDGVVLLCNCDKTTPAQLMAAASADIPAIQMSGGPRAAGYWRNEPIATGTDFWKYWDEYRTGKLSDQEWRQFESCIACTSGACNEMGTASTMVSMSEALGMMPAGTCGLPANDSRRLAASEAAGRQIVQLVRDDVRPSAILTANAFENAIRVLMAIGGSTNAGIHLIAIAGRRRIDLPLSLFDDLSRQTPTLANLKPSGQYLMVDMHRAGGLPAVMQRISDDLHKDCATVSGATIGQIIERAHCYDDDVIRPVDRAILDSGALVVLKGNLVPSGAVLKVSASDPSLHDHTGPAYIFDDYHCMLAQLDDDDLPVTPEHVLILRNIGPCGLPGMPEWGSIPLPGKLYKQGVRDMVRISDGRMSGTSYGTVILHAAPEAAVGGPLAIVRSGDMIRLSVEKRRLDLLIDQSELHRRLADFSPPPPKHVRGYPRLFVDHVLQADRGCDMDFLRPESADALTFVHPVVGRS